MSVGVDDLTTLTLNYEWRRFLSYAVDSVFRRFDSVMDDAQQDAFNVRFGAFFADLYTLEAGGGGGVELAVKVRRTANLGLVAGVPTAISWTSEDYDIGGFWDISNPTQFVVPAGADGHYNIIAGAVMGLGALTSRHLLIRVNGVPHAKMVHGSEGYFGYNVNVHCDLVAGDIVLIEAYSTAAATLLYEPNNSPFFAMYRIPFSA